MGLDPTNKPEFATVPPHFKNEGNPITKDTNIKEAMHMICIPILDEYHETINPAGLLLFVLVNLIYGTIV